MSRAGLVVPFSVRGNLTQNGLALVVLVHVHVVLRLQYHPPPSFPTLAYFVHGRD